MGGILPFMAKRQCELTCEFDGCGSPAFSKGHCQNHYYYRVRHGLVPRPICIIDGCAGAVYQRGMCNKHLMRVKRYGDPSICKKIPATQERTKRLAAAARKRYKATPYGRLRRRFSDAKRRLRAGAESSAGLLRTELLALWAGDVCALCGGALGEDKTFDHKVSLGAGGDNTIANLQLAHLKCNQRKNKGAPRRRKDCGDAPERRSVL